MSSKHDIQPMGNVNCIFRDLKIDFRRDFNPSDDKLDVNSGQTMAGQHRSNKALIIKQFFKVKIKLAAR